MDINGLKINEQGYFDMPGLSVLVYNNTFPDGKQGGVEIIQHDDRVASCGELRLDVAPGQWQPVPRLGDDEAAVPARLWTWSWATGVPIRNGAKSRCIAVILTRAATSPGLTR